MRRRMSKPRGLIVRQYASWHRRELHVLCYHGFRGNYPYPFWGVILMVIFHYFIIQNYQNNSQIVIHLPINVTLPYSFF